MTVPTRTASMSEQHMSFCQFNHTHTYTHNTLTSNCRALPMSSSRRLTSWWHDVQNVFIKGRKSGSSESGQTFVHGTECADEAARVVLDVTNVTTKQASLEQFTQVYVCIHNYSETSPYRTQLGPSWLSCIERCLQFRGKFAHNSMWLGQQMVSSLEKCPLFRASFIVRFHCTFILPLSLLQTSTDSKHDCVFSQLVKPQTHKGVSMVKLVLELDELEPRPSDSQL